MLNKRGMLTPPEVAKRFGVSKMAVFKWIKRGIIPNTKLGCHQYIWEENLDMFSKIRNVISKQEKIPMIVTEPDMGMRTRYYKLFSQHYQVTPLIINSNYISQIKKVMPLFIVMDIDWIHFEAKEIIKQIKADPELDYISFFITTHAYTVDNVCEFLEIGCEQFLPKDTGNDELIARINSWLLLKYGFNSI